MPRPFLPADKKKLKIQVLLDPAIHDMLVKISEKRAISLSAATRQLLLIGHAAAQAHLAKRAASKVASPEASDRGVAEGASEGNKKTDANPVHAAEDNSRMDA